MWGCATDAKWCKRLCSKTVQGDANGGDTKCCKVTQRNTNTSDAKHHQAMLAKKTTCQHKQYEPNRRCSKVV